MKNVRSSYIIQSNTIALLPVRRTNYSTKVLTMTGEIYVKQTPFEIIDYSCIMNSATYEGKKGAVKRLTKFKNKVPIPINTFKGIYGFPTSSPTKGDCIWLFYNHIREIEENPNNESTTDKRKSTVHFMNDTKLDLDISYFTLKQQYYKTAVCKSMFDNQKQVD